MIAYVATFVPEQTGDHYSPHATTGVAPREHPRQDAGRTVCVRSLLRLAGAAVYQLGPFGTAREETQGVGVQAILGTDLAKRRRTTEEEKRPSGF